MGLLARMTKAAGRAAKNEVKRTLRRNARKAARSIRKRLDQRGKPSTRRKSPVARKPVKQLPKRKQKAAGCGKPASRRNYTVALYRVWRRTERSLAAVKGDIREAESEASNG